MSGKEIPIIVPNKIFHQKDISLSEDNLKFIRAVLEKSCINDNCISKAKLYSEIKKPLSLKLEKYQFEQAISNAIKNNKIPGFAIKRGAFGGICRVAYSGSKNTAATKKVRCNITLSNSKAIGFMAVESKVIKVITEVFKGTPAANGDGSLFVNNHAYKLPKNIDSEYILEFIIKNIRW